MGPASNSPAVEALRLLERAEALAPGRPDITERLARAHELLGRHDSATQYRLLSARQWEEHGEAEAAERTYRAVLEREPAHAVAGQCLMDLLLDSGREAEAGELILACAERLADRGEVARAIEVVRRGLERVPEAALERRLAELLEGAGAGADAAQALLKLARQAAGAGRRMDAITFYRRARALAPEANETTTELAELLAEEGQLEEARRLYVSLADGAEHCLAWDEALGWLARAEALGEPPPLLLSRLAEAARKADRPEEARRALARLADVYESLSNTRQMAETLRRLLELSPDDVAGRARLAEAFHAMGQPGQAAQQLLEAARQEAQTGATERALVLLRQAYQWAPEDAGVVEALVDALEAAGKREEAAEVCLERARGMHLPRQASQIEELCGRALELAPECAAARERRVEALAALGRREEAAESALGLAHLRAREGALPQAESWVQRARQLVPEHPAARELLFNLLEQSGDAERLQRQVLEEVGDLTALGRRLEALQLLAWGAGKFPDSEAILRRRLELAEQSEDAALVGATLAGLAQLYARRPASPEALSVFAQRARLMPEDRPAAEQWLVCAEALNAASAIQEARQHLVGVLRRAGDRQALLAQLERLIAARPDDLTLLEERLAVAGAEAPVEMQTAWRRELAEAAFRAGLYGKAMEVYGRMAEAEPLAVVWHEQRALCALKLGSPADAVAAYRAGAAKLWEEGRAAEAYGLLARAIALAPAQPALRAEEVELLLALDEPGRAAASLRELSALLAREGSLEKAVAALARAVKLLPDEPALRVELIDLYRRAGMTEAAGEAARAHARSCYEAGRLEEALEMLERAVAVDEHHRPTLLLRIEWLVEAGRKEEAARAALELSQRERQQGQLAEARETLAAARQLLPDHGSLEAAWRQMEADYAEYRRRSGLLERIEMANRLLAQGRTEAAVADFEEMLLSQPDNLEVRAGLAAAYRACGRLAEAAELLLSLARVYAERAALPAAMRQLEEVLAFLPNHQPALEQLCALAERTHPRKALEYLVRLAEARAAAGQWSAAAETYRRALAEHPDHLPAWQGLAEAFLADGRAEEAVRAHLEAARHCEVHFNSGQAMEHCRKALAIRPDCVEAEERLVALYGQLGRADEVEAHLLRAVELLERRGDGSRAARLLEEHLSARPEALRLRARLLELYRGLGRREELVEQHLVLARLYAQRGDEASAEGQYAAVLTLEEGNVAAHEALAAAGLAAGRRREAADHFTALAERFRREGIVGRALDYYRRALECIPDDPALREAVAAAYVEEGSPAKAVNEFILVGDVHFRNRAYEEALAVYRRALELGPDNLRTLGKLVSAYEAAGEVEAAAEVLFDMADIYARRSLTWKSREAATRALRLAPGEAVLRRYLERSAVAGELASAVAAVEELMPFFPRRFQGRARELLAEGGRGGRAPTEARPQAASSFGQPAWQAFRDPSPAAGAPAPPHGHGRAPEPPAPSESGADPRRTLVEALHLFSRRRYSRALAKLDEVAGLPRAGLSQNDLADLFSAKGQCLIELGYPRDAIEPFESGLSLSGLDAEREMSLQYGLARALEESGDRERAMDLYKWVYLKDASYRDVKIRLLWSKKK